MPRQSDLERECCLTRQTLPADQLIRFAVGPDGVLWPDVDAKAPGRGVWVTASAEAVAEAVRKKAFARSLKAAVTVPDDLPGLTRQHLERRLLGALGLAKKAGQMVTGMTRVRAAIEARDIVALITATDASGDGRGKLVALLRAHFPEHSPPHFEFLASSQLGLATGGENVIHAALSKGAAAQSALTRALRLAHYSAAPLISETAVHG